MSKNKTDSTIKLVSMIFIDERGMPTPVNNTEGECTFCTVSQLAFIRDFEVDAAGNRKSSHTLMIPAARIIVMIPYEETE